jgi:hypothetical protein
LLCFWVKREFTWRISPAFIAFVADRRYIPNPGGEVKFQRARLGGKEKPQVRGARFEDGMKAHCGSVNHFYSLSAV